MRTVIYPGSFDPLTNGHLDIVQRAAKLFDTVIVAIANNEEKKPLFTLKERLALVTESVRELSNVKVDSFNGLLVDLRDMPRDVQEIAFAKGVIPYIPADRKNRW